MNSLAIGYANSGILAKISFYIAAEVSFKLRCVAADSMGFPSANSRFAYESVKLFSSCCSGPISKSDTYC